MGSGYSQATAGINWDEWSRVVEAAQDPRHRDAVQQFLAQADLSAEVPAALDEKVLAPRRAEGATGEQCAYVLANLGFASLVAGTRGSAEFAMACGRLVEQLAPDTADLALRRLFLATKSELLIAVLTGQPHLVWDKVSERCSAYLSGLHDNLDALPEESVEQNAMAAFSFAAQCLSRIHEMHAVGHYAAEISRLVAAALALASQLLPAFVSRMWSSLLPGTDAGVLFRRIGATAERCLQNEEDSLDHASRGLTYIDEILSQRTAQSAADLERLLLLRAELLLTSGQHTEALEQAQALQSSSDPSVRTSAFAVKARCLLRAGNPQEAAECLAQVAPTASQVLESWRRTWVGDSGDGVWTGQSDAVSPQEQLDIWRLQAAAAADSRDMPGFLEVANRSTGFLADALVQDRQQRTGRKPDAAGIEPAVALDEVFARLDDGTALLQIIVTGEGILTWVARKEDGDVSQFVASDTPSVVTGLLEAHKTWSRAYFAASRHGKDAMQNETEVAGLFSRLMDEVGHNWGELLHTLVDDDITQLILIGDDLVDIPLHATRIGAANEPLIDRVPVSYVPSLSALGACLERTPVNESQRKGVALRSLVDAALDSAVSQSDTVAGILDTKSCSVTPPVADAFWSDVAAAQVLHIVARASHDARMPFDSLLGAGSLDLSIGQLVADLDLAQCDIVSNLHCESALPSTLRAPGLDLAAVFLAAGARTVLASTWLTEDEVASELAQSFFHGWVNGHAPSSAYREALLQLRSRRATLEDFQWAGMRLVGAP